MRGSLDFLFDRWQQQRPPQNCDDWRNNDHRNERKDEWDKVHHQWASREKEIIEESQTIVGAFDGGGKSSSARGAHAQRTHAKEVLSLKRPSEAQSKESLALTFTNEDPYGLLQPHDDALIVTMAITNYPFIRFLLIMEARLILVLALIWTNQVWPRKVKAGILGLGGLCRRKSSTDGLNYFANNNRHYIEIDYHDGILPNYGSPLSYNTIIRRQTSNKWKAIISLTI